MRPVGIPWIADAKLLTNKFGGTSGVDTGEGHAKAVAQGDGEVGVASAEGIEHVREECVVGTAV